MDEIPAPRVAGSGIRSALRCSPDGFAGRQEVGAGTHVAGVLVRSPTPLRGSTVIVAQAMEHHTQTNPCAGKARVLLEDVLQLLTRALRFANLQKGFGQLAPDVEVALSANLRETRNA